MFDFVFVILCVAGLLGLLAHAALHEDEGKSPMPARAQQRSQ